MGGIETEVGGGRMEGKGPSWVLARHWAISLTLFFLDFDQDEDIELIVR